MMEGSSIKYVCSHVMTRKESADVILEYSFIILLKLTFANEKLRNPFFFSNIT